MLSNEIIEKLKSEQELTIEEISFVLPEIILNARERLSKVPIGNEKKCIEADQIMQLVCDRMNVCYFPLDTRDLKDNDLFHKFGLVIFNVKSNPVIFLTDLTYNQFKVEPEYQDISPSDFLREELFNNLKQNGYLTFTRDIFENYIMSFISASTKINKNNFFDSIHNELTKFGIKFNLEETYILNNENFSKNVSK